MVCVGNAEKCWCEECCSVVVWLFAAEVIIVEDVLLKPAVVVCVRGGWEVFWKILNDLKMELMQGMLSFISLLNFSGPSSCRSFQPRGNLICQVSTY